MTGLRDAQLRSPHCGRWTRFHSSLAGFTWAPLLAIVDIEDILSCVNRCIEVLSSGVGFACDATKTQHPSAIFMRPPIYSPAPCAITQNQSSGLPIWATSSSPSPASFSLRLRLHHFSAYACCQITTTSQLRKLCSPLHRTFPPS